jgi:multiple sugar transport system permease protein
MAASMLVMLPVLILFFLAQKTFIQGIATTGLK